MKHYRSVFHSEVKLPHVAESFDVLPDHWRQWYRRVFEDGFRGPPPNQTEYSVKPLLTSHAHKPVALSYDCLLRFHGTLFELHDFDGTRVARCDDGIWLDGHERRKLAQATTSEGQGTKTSRWIKRGAIWACLLYTSDAADE